MIPYRDNDRACGYDHDTLKVMHGRQKHNSCPGGDIIEGLIKRPSPESPSQAPVGKRATAYTQGTRAVPGDGDTAALLFYSEGVGLASRRHALHSIREPASLVSYGAERLKVLAFAASLGSKARLRWRREHAVKQQVDQRSKWYSRATGTNV